MKRYQIYVTVKTPNDGKCTAAKYVVTQLFGVEAQKSYSPEYEVCVGHFEVADDVDPAGVPADQLVEMFGRIVGVVVGARLVQVAIPEPVVTPAPLVETEVVVPAATSPDPSPSEQGDHPDGHPVFG